MGDNDHRSILDYTLVPAGVLVLLLYHLYLLRRIVVRPSTTVISVNAIKRRIWVHAMMSNQPKNGMLTVHILCNNLMASTLLASTSITLCSLIAVLLNYTSSSQGSILYGDDGDTVRSVKYISILICFLVAFLCNVQSIRYYSHASFLFNVPLENDSVNGASTVEYVVRAVNRGSYWWSLGLKAFYFSFPLFLWVFGPIPMFLCSVVMVVLLYFIDRVPTAGKKQEKEEKRVLSGERLA